MAAALLEDLSTRDWDHARPFEVIKGSLEVRGIHNSNLLKEIMD